MKKILYIEDNEMNRDMLGRRLTRREFEVIFAFDGQEGLEKMKSENPDLVLMDMGLPILDGWEATTQAKADPEISSIPIIPKIKNAAIKFGTIPIKDNLTFLNKIMNIIKIPVITSPNVKI